MGTCEGWDGNSVWLSLLSYAWAAYSPGSWDGSKTGLMTGVIMFMCNERQTWRIPAQYYYSNAELKRNKVFCSYPNSKLVNFPLKWQHLSDSTLVGIREVPWPSCLVYQTCVAMPESSECGFESWQWLWHLYSSASNVNVIAMATGAPSTAAQRCTGKVEGFITAH